MDSNLPTVVKVKEQDHWVHIWWMAWLVSTLIQDFGLKKMCQVLLKPKLKFWELTHKWTELNSQTDVFDDRHKINLKCTFFASPSLSKSRVIPLNVWNRWVWKATGTEGKITTPNFLNWGARMTWEIPGCAHRARLMYMLRPHNKRLWPDKAVHYQPT